MMIAPIPAATMAPKSPAQPAAPPANTVVDEYRPADGIIESWRTVTRPASVQREPAAGQVARASDELLEATVTLRSGVSLQWDSTSKDLAISRPGAAKPETVAGVQLTLAKDGGYQSAGGTVKLQGDQVEQVIENGGGTTLTERSADRGPIYRLDAGASRTKVGSREYVAYSGATVASEGYNRRPITLTPSGSIEIARNGTVSHIAPFVPVEALQSPSILARQEAARVETALSGVTNALKATRDERIVAYRALDNGGYDAKSLRQDVHNEAISGAAVWFAVAAIGGMGASMILGLHSIAGIAGTAVAAAVAGAATSRASCLKRLDANATKGLTAHQANLQSVLDKNRALQGASAATGGVK